MIHKAQTSHIGSNFSVLDMAVVLNEIQTEEDVLIWSKGWAAASAYYFLWKRGIITEQQLDSFPNKPFLGLVERDAPGIVTAGGSMGHGLPVACGMALARKRSGTPGKIYVIMSDGEMNEGTTWEAAQFATQHGLDNLVVLVDKNGWQAMGRTKDVLYVNPVSAFSAFGWATLSCNGHDYEKLEKFLVHGSKEKGLPLVIVGETIKGKGVSFMEDQLVFHYKYVDADIYERAMKELV